jgi:hypothetical protein
VLRRESEAPFLRGLVAALNIFFATGAGVTEVPWLTCVLTVTVSERVCLPPSDSFGSLNPLLRGNAHASVKGSQPALDKVSNRRKLLV